MSLMQKYKNNNNNTNRSMFNINKLMNKKIDDYNKGLSRNNYLNKNKSLKNENIIHNDIKNTKMTSLKNSKINININNKYSYPIQNMPNINNM